MKRIFTILFALCLVAALSLSISAESTNKLTYAVGASAPTVSANTEFTVFVDITENTGICWLKAVVTYDSSVLSYVGASTDSSAYDTNKITVNHRSGKAIIILGSQTVLQETNPVIYKNTGRLVALTFKANPLATGETKINIKTDEGDVLKVVNGVSELEYTITNATLSLRILNNADHTCVPGSEVKENVVPANCNQMGSYDSVIKCTICGVDISRTKVVLPANDDHLPGEATKENVVPGTCKTEETYNLVTRCTRCNKIVKSETKKGNKGNHVEDLPKVEYTASTCKVEGTFVEIYNCKACGIELSRKTNKLPLGTHTPGAPKMEDIVAATCTKAGSYKSITHCSVCNEKLSSETVVQEKIPHTPGEPVEKNRVESKDCQTAGSCDYVIYCKECNTEISKTTQALPVAAHTPGNPPTETEPQRCTVCGFVLKAAIGHQHNWSNSLTSNETGHWYACSGCSEKKDFANHDYDNNCDATCNTCGAQRTPGDHVYGSWTTVTEATTTTEGKRERKCNVCGYTESEIIPVKVEDTTATPPATTTTPSDTHNPEETNKGNEATDPADTTKPDDTTNPKKENGCKSAVSVGVAFIAIFGSAIILKKRD